MTGGGGVGACQGRRPLCELTVVWLRRRTFVDHILHSDRIKRLFEKYATLTDAKGPVDELGA
jgi:hypothetical protein